jgi:hypothetical protein
VNICSIDGSKSTAKRRNFLGTKILYIFETQKITLPSMSAVSQRVFVCDIPDIQLSGPPLKT